jgi:hypothetical protein
MQTAFAGINSVVVGLLLAALFTPVRTSAIYKPQDFALSLVAFVALLFWKPLCEEQCRWQKCAGISAIQPPAVAQQSDFIDGRVRCVLFPKNSPDKGNKRLTINTFGADVKTEKKDPITLKTWTLLRLESQT